MFDLRQGYVFRARAGVDAETMMSDIQFRVDTVLAPNRKSSNWVVIFIFRPTY